MIHRHYRSKQTHCVLVPLLRSTLLSTRLHYTSERLGLKEDTSCTTQVILSACIGSNYIWSSRSLGFGKRSKIIFLHYTTKFIKLVLIEVRKCGAIVIDPYLRS